MKCRLLTCLALSFALATSASAADLTAAERAALAAQPAPQLESLRAGDETGVASFALVEREALVCAQAAAPGLDELRAGDLEDNDWLIIIGVVAVVALAIAL